MDIMSDEEMAAPEPDVPSEELVAMKLADAGLSPEIISYSLDLPITRVRSIIIKRRPSPVPLIDEKLADGVRNLAAAALREAHTMLEFGPTEQKLVIIKSMLSGLSRHVAASGSSDAEEARESLEAMFIEMREGEIPERELIVTESTVLDVMEVDDATATALAEPSYDQD